MWPPDFKSPEKPPSEVWYDLEYDRVLLEQSIAKQYGVLPSAQEELSYSDWSKMVGGLMEDTPLGQVVAIRCEKKQDVIKSMTPHQLALRRDWMAFRVAHQGQGDGERMRQLEAMIAGIFG